MLRRRRCRLSMLCVSVVCYLLVIILIHGDPPWSRREYEDSYVAWSKEWYTEGTEPVTKSTKRRNFKLPTLPYKPTQPFRNTSTKPHFNVSEELQLGDKTSISVKNRKIQNKPTKHNVSSYLKVFDLYRQCPERHECVFLSVKPTFPLCIHDIRDDIYISAQIKSKGVYERNHMDVMKMLLEKNKNIGLIDIGANIGLFSLYAAKLGHPVVAVEPLLENIKKFHKSVKINHLEQKITLLQNAVSDERVNATLVQSSNNRGNNILYPYGTYAKKLENVFSVTLDDLLEVITFDKAILKVDIEGFEHRAFVNSSKLFKKLQVPYIFIEWDIIGQYCGTGSFGNSVVDADDVEENRQIVKQMINQFLKLGYTPHYVAVNYLSIQLNLKSCHNWPADVIWMKT